MKFLVEINPKEGRDETTAAFLSGTLLSEDCYSKLKVDISVTEYKEPRQVKTKRTGVLSLPKPINYVCCDLIDSFGLKRENFKLKNGDKINLSELPELETLCKDIKSEIDWSSVKVGDLVRCDFMSKGFSIGYYSASSCNEYAMLIYGDMSCENVKITKSEIKSVTIIKEAQE
jgi:hypothetical protein